eukprot:m.44496 g.44496  ORF g.44496 m.44496 type:complete len:211 (+) comp13018_c0_seq1:188-820(+)
MADSMAREVNGKSYYKGFMTRDVAERELMAEAVGTFLFRRSETRNGLSLSIRVLDRVKHYMVAARKDGRYVVVGKDKDFGSIHELVQYHMTEPPSTTDGVRLRLPNVPEPPPPRNGSAPLRAPAPLPSDSTPEPPPRVVANAPNDYVSLFDDGPDAAALAAVQERATARLSEHKAASSASLNASGSSSKPGSVKRHAYEDDFTPSGPPPS